MYKNKYKINASFITHATIIITISMYLWTLDYTSLQCYRLRCFHPLWFYLLLFPIYQNELILIDDGYWNTYTSRLDASYAAYCIERCNAKLSKKCNFLLMLLNGLFHQYESYWSSRIRSSIKGEERMRPKCACVIRKRSISSIEVHL